jgi:hypothetical protein
MLRSSRVATQMVVSRAVFSSTESVSYLVTRTYKNLLFYRLIYMDPKADSKFKATTYAVGWNS